MLTPGLVSVTFRKKEKCAVAQIASRAGLKSIEWGGDVHVPTLDAAAAAEAVSCSAENGIGIVSYGSYYRCCGTEEDIRNVVLTANMTGAGMIRVWAGNKWSNDADAEYRQLVSLNIRKMCEIAAEYSISVSAEFHGGTLTDTYDSALGLVNEVGCGNMFLYWQPNQFRDDRYNTAALRAVLPYLSYVHVFAWSDNIKYPLCAQEMQWRNYIDIIRTDGKDHNLLLEFVCDNTEEQLYRDAECLLGWIG